MTRGARAQREPAWDRDGFFDWLDQRIAEVEPPIPDMQSLADLAEISHSALSNWRSGKYKPSLDTLRQLAKPLKVPVDVVWSRAGLIVETGHRHVLTSEEQAGIDIIEATQLDAETKEKLKVLYLARVARERKERLRQLREQIDLLSPE